MDRSLCRSNSQGAVFLAPDSTGAPSVALSGGGTLDGAAARVGHYRIFQIDQDILVPSPEIDRVRSDVAEDRALLAALDGRKAHGRSRLEEHQAAMGE